MTEWEPATDAEVAMRDALRTDDQESYFRILAGVDLLLTAPDPDARGRIEADERHSGREPLVDLPQIDVRDPIPNPSLPCKTFPVLIGIDHRLLSHSRQ